MFQRYTENVTATPTNHSPVR